MMKSLTKTVVVIFMMSSIVSCKKSTQRNYEFFPQMYQSSSYETYGEYEVFPGEQSAMVPAEGTIARGYSLFSYKNTTEDYERAKVELINPIDSISYDEPRAKELYDVYCGLCHGNKGDGQGNLVKREKLLGIPSYADRDITDGSTYHVIYYGRNAMGSYANQLNEEERWQVSAYVMNLRADLQ